MLHSYGIKLAWNVVNEHNLNDTIIRLLLSHMWLWMHGICRIRQNFRVGKLSRLCTKHYSLENFRGGQAVAIMYCTQQVIQGENFRDQLKNHESFLTRKFCRIRYSPYHRICYPWWYGEYTIRGLSYYDCPKLMKAADRNEGIFFAWPLKLLECTPY